MSASTTSQSKALAAYRTWKLWIEPERLVLRRVLRGWLRDVPAQSTVVEIGAGTAFMEPVVRAEVQEARYVSTDIAPTDNTDLVVDATALPFSDSSVDVVMALEVLEHMPQPRALVSEASRVTRSGGRLILTVPFMFGVHDFRDYQRFTPLGMERLLAEYGFTLSRTSPRGGVFVASTGLLRTRLLNAIVGKPGDWRAMGRLRKVRWFLSTVVLTPWAVVTVASYGLDAVLDRHPVSPPGYFFLAVRD